MARRYIRHHNGTVHSVNAEDFFAHLAQARMIQYEDKSVEPAREARPDEIAAYWTAMGFVYVPETDEALTPDEHAARQSAAAKAAKSSAAAAKE